MTTRHEPIHRWRVPPWAAIALALATLAAWIVTREGTLRTAALHDLASRVSPGITEGELGQLLTEYRPRGLEVIRKDKTVYVWARTGPLDGMVLQVEIADGRVRRSWLSSSNDD